MDTTGLILIVATTIIFSLIGLIYTWGKKISLEDYITARGSILLTASAASLVASAMGAWILFSPAETGARAGIIALIGYGLGSASALWIFAFVGKRLREIMPNGHALTEYVIHRFGKGMYVFVLLITIFYMGVYLTAELTGISQAAEMVFGIPIIFTAVVVGLGTLVYTAAGGLKASIFTDVIQYWVMLPLIAIIFFASVFFLGGTDAIFSKVNQAAPQLMNFFSWPGIEYGITLIIAIIGAEIFNQANWQRVYSAKDEKVMRRSFLLSGLVVIPIIVALGFFGIFAVASNVADNPSIALFTFLQNVTPAWLLFTTMILAIVIVMSTIDTLLNGLVSLFTVDIVRLKPNIDKKKILSLARWFTVILAGVAVLISTKALSVLYLFLIADLVCAAAAFPTLYGLYSKKYTGGFAVITSILGIIAGAFLFPDPNFTRGNLLWSFGLAFLIPTILSIILTKFGREFDFKLLNEKVTVFDK